MKKKFIIITTIFIIISLTIFLFFLFNKEDKKPLLIKKFEDKAPLIIKEFKDIKNIKNKPVLEPTPKKQVQQIKDFTHTKGDIVCLFGNKDFSSFDKQLCQKQNNFNEALIEFYKILKKINQRSFLCRSLALGAAREKHFIKHDYDIDIGIFYEEYKINNINLYKYIKKGFSDKFRVADIFGKLDNSYEFFVYYKKYNIRIDIIFFYKQNKIYYHALHNGMCKKKSDGFCKIAHSPFDLKKQYFMGNYYFVPHLLHNYLTENYGKDWMVIKEYKYWTGLKSEFKNILN